MIAGQLADLGRGDDGRGKIDGLREGQRWPWGDWRTSSVGPTTMAAGRSAGWESNGGGGGAIGSMGGMGDLVFYEHCSLFGWRCTGAPKKGEVPRCLDLD